MKKQKAIIVDGHNFLFRGFYGVPVQVKRPDGTPINAVYGFFSLLRAALQDVNPDYLVVVFDTETSADAKKQLNPKYKANRVIEDTTIFFQLSLIKKCLDIMGVSWVEDVSHEADDVIGTYSKKFTKHGVEVYICSNDHDFIQLIHDDVFVLRGMRGSVEKYDHEYIVQKVGVTPSQYLDFLALTGDPSDNIKGVKGIGKKRAAMLLQEYGNLEGMYQLLHTFSPSLKKALEFQKEELLERRRFLAINTRLTLYSTGGIKAHALSEKIIPEKMGEFLTKYWVTIL